jgi:hypothetical protein
MPQIAQERIHAGSRGASISRTQSLRAILGRLNENVPFHNRVDLSSFVNWKGNTTSPIHRWLRYREAYSPNLITKLSFGDRILDPFCGCGSILLGAAERGYTSVGIDINPLAVFATQVKLSPLSRSQFQDLLASSFAVAHVSAPHGPPS